MSPALQADSLQAEPQGRDLLVFTFGKSSTLSSTSTPFECRVSKNSKERQESLPQWSM